MPSVDAASENLSAGDGSINKNSNNCQNVDNTDTSHRSHVRNRDLSPSEKAAKKIRKAQLKQATRRRKFVVRLQQAEFRKDTACISATKAELEAWDKKYGIIATELEENNFHSQIRKSSNNSALPPPANPLDASIDGKPSIFIEPVEQIYKKLNALLTKPTKSHGSQHTSSDRKHDKNDNDDDDPGEETSTTDPLSTSHPVPSSSSSSQPHQQRQKLDPASIRQKRLVESKHLLDNMSRGTQELTMFRNAEALLGYTRLKFSERARLVADGLTRLHSTGNGLGGDDDDDGVIRSMRERLQNVQSVVSIGCGPGCDAVGLGLYLQQSANRKLRRAVLLDWAMDDWQTIAAPLRSVVVPSIMDEMVWGRCNVLKDFSVHPDNADARRLLIGDSTNTNNKNDRNDDAPLVVDMIVTSYLLTETRGKWHSFYDGLLSRAAPGTLVLFNEPTAWQLHELLRRRGRRNNDDDNDRYLQYVWLDSSMNRPELQSLERRIGPAVLLCMVTKDE